MCIRDRNDAVDLLEVYNTGGQTLAAQSDVIELIYQAAKAKMLTRGLPAGPGAATGRIYLLSLIHISPLTPARSPSSASTNTVWNRKPRWTFWKWTTPPSGTPRSVSYTHLSYCSFTGGSRPAGVHVYF